MNVLYNKALREGATDFGISWRKGKRFYVIYNNKFIHFGSATGQTYYDHKDERKRSAWRARHSQIGNSDGIPFYTIKTSPEYWAWHILW
jgi:hypothetical protein